MSVVTQQDPRQRSLFTEDQWGSVPFGPRLNKDGIPEWLERKISQENDDQAYMEALFEALSPCPGRLIVTKPEVAAAHKQRVLTSGLYAPDRKSVFEREYGLRCTVLKMHKKDAQAMVEGIRPGVDVVLAEHCGHPVYLGRETPWWIVGLGEVIAVIEESR